MDDTQRQRPVNPEAQTAEHQSRPEPVPAVQLEYLRRLGEEAGEPVEELGSQGEAYQRMRELQHKVGRRPKRILVDDQTDG